MVLTLPNILTFLRILSIPFFAIALWYGHMVEACLLFAAAGLTDLLDGYIARRFNQRSELGAVLDPAADKLLMTTAFVLMAFSSGVSVARIPVWVAILAISRDVLIALAAFLSAGNYDSRRFRPSLLGKATTALELFAISTGLAVNAFPWQPWFSRVVPGIYYVVAAFVLASGLHYFFRGQGVEKAA